MLVFSFLAVLAVTSAAPQYHHHHGHPFHGPLRPPVDPYFRDNMFDTGRFWAEINDEMAKIDVLFREFNERFPVIVGDSGVKGNEYVVTINLNSFDEKDIKVKARTGVLMVQAVHKSADGSERSYLDVKTLPSYVNVNGTWIYDRNVLKITFPLNSRPDDDADKVTTEEVEIETQAPEEKSREEMDTDQQKEVNHEADVGLEERDDNDILSNVIPDTEAVEATTYAVDLKNEVEFVPVKY